MGHTDEPSSKNPSVNGKAAEGMSAGRPKDVDSKAVLAGVGCKLASCVSYDNTLHTSKTTHSDLRTWYPVVSSIKAVDV